MWDRRHIHIFTFFLAISETGAHALRRGIDMTQSEPEEDEILTFIVSDELLEEAAASNFSMADCTEVRTCPVPN